MTQALKLVFVQDGLKAEFQSEMLPILDLEHDVVLTDDRSLLNELKAQGIHAVSLLDFSDEETDYANALSFLNRIQSLKVNGRDVLELFKVDGISIWHMLPSFFYKAFYKIFNYYSLFERAINSIHPAEVVVFSCARMPIFLDTLNDVLLGQRILKSVADKHTIPCSDVPFSPYSRKDRLINAYLPFTLLMVWISRIGQFLKRKWFYRAPKFNRDKNRSALFISASSYWRYGYNPFTKNFTKIEPFAYPVIHELTNDFSVECLDVQYVDSHNQIFKERFADPHVHWDRFESSLTVMMSIRALIQTMRFIRRLKPDWSSFKQALSKESGMSISPLFDGLIRFTIKDLFYCFLSIQMAQKTIVQKQPNLVFMTYETGPYERSILYACQQKGIPTIGLQHGAAYVRNPDYERNYSYNPDQSLIPTHFMAYGEQTLETLKHGGFPKDRIQVFGNPQYDFYKTLLEDREALKSEILKKYSLPADKKIALFISSQAWEGITPGNIDHHRKLVYESIAADPNYFIVSKLHYDEDPAGHETILSHMPEMKGRYLLTSDGLLAEYLLVSDLAIMYVSTAGYEAILLDVPLLSINFTNYLNYIPYIQKEAIPVVRTKEALENHLAHYTRESDDYAQRRESLKLLIHHDIKNYPSFNASEEIAQFARSLIA